MEFTPVNFEDFSGGMTDQVVGGEANQGEIVENFHITTYKKLKSREGSELSTDYGNTLTTLQPAGGTGNIINFQKDTALLARTKNKLFVPTGGNWAALTGPNGSQAFVAVDSSSSPFTFTSPTSYVSQDEWNHHHFLVGYDDSTGSNIFARPVKVYQDTSGVFKVLNAGLPKFPMNTDSVAQSLLLSAAILLANDIKAKMNTHFSSYGVGGTGKVLSTVAHQTQQASVGTADATDLDSLIALTKDLYAAYQAHVQDARFISHNYYGLYGGVLSVARYHGDFTTSGIQLNLNFDCPFTGNPQDIFTCATTLNNLRLVFNMHVESYATALDQFVANDASSNPGPWVHPVKTAQVTAGVLGLYPAPVYVLSGSTWANPALFAATCPPRGSPTITDPLLGLLMDAADQIRYVLYSHFTNGNAGHSTHTPASPDHLGLATKYISDRYSLVAYVHMCLDAYNFHVGYHDSGHNGTPDSTSATAEATGLSYTQVNDSGNLLPPDISITTGCSFLWNIVDTLRKKLYHHTLSASGGTNIHYGTVDATSFTGYPAFTPVTRLTFNSQIYSFLYANKYTNIAGVEFEDIGTPVNGPAVVYPSFNTWSTAVLTLADYVADLETSSEAQRTQIDVKSMPTLATSENLPTTTATIQIYRTKNLGSLFYKVGEIKNGTTTFTDTVLDVNLVEELYTTGGVVGNDPPPKAKCFAIGPNETGYYGGVVELDKTGKEVFLPRRVRQSLVGVPNSCPEEFFCDLDTEVMTLGVARGSMVVVTKKAVYRIDGQMDERGNGVLAPVQIADNIGGVSVNGGISHNDIFFFAGDNGFYMTDGFKVYRLSRHLLTTYSNLTASNKGRTIQAVLDRDNHKIYWAANQGSTGFNDVLFELNLQIPFIYLGGDDDEARGSFTRHSNGTNFAPTAIGFFNGSVYRGDYQGFLFKHTATDLSDPEISRAAGGSLTGDVVNIPWKWRSTALSFGTIAVRKFAPYVTFVFANHGNLSVQANSINDLNTGNIRALNPIRYRDGGAQTITAQRTFPVATDPNGRSGGLPFMYKQVEITAANVFIVSSDNSAPVTLASTSTNHAILDTSSYVWPSNVGNYTIGFGPLYPTFYTITSRVSDDTLLLSGSPGITGSQKWEIRGVPHDEVCELLGVTILVAPYGQTQPTSPAGVGANA